MNRRTFLYSCAAPMFVARVSAADRAPRVDYREDHFEHEGIRLRLWARGRGPLVFVLHEMNGLTPQCFTLGDDLVAKGFSVVIPEFFGGAGGPYAGYFKACEGRSLFTCFAHTTHGRVEPWIKALAERKSGRENFGAIGNCMTGALPLLMLRTERCVAPVLCQPAFPFRGGFQRGDRAAAIGLSDADLEFAAMRSRRDHIPVLAVRYEVDGLCPPKRFDMLRKRFGPNLHCLELKGKGHSTLITHRCDVAFETVVAFLKHRLTGTSWTPAGECQSVACGVATEHGSR
jgi:dienelactone hydrolase